MLEKLKEIIVNYVEVDANDIKEDSRFIEDLNFNSYDFMSFVGEIEEEFDIEVEERDAIKIKTVADAISYFESLQQ